MIGAVLVNNRLLNGDSGSCTGTVAPAVFWLVPSAEAPPVADGEAGARPSTGPQYGKAQRRRHYRNKAFHFKFILSSVINYALGKGAPIKKLRAQTIQAAINALKRKRLIIFRSY